MEVTTDGIAVVTLDAPGEKMNTLSASLNKSFDDILTKLENNSSIRAAVLISGKPDNFIAGADITMLVRLGSTFEVLTLHRESRDCHYESLHVWL